MRFLSTIDSVAMGDIYCSSPCQGIQKMAVRIGAPVTELNLSVRPSFAKDATEDIVVLQKCPRLQRLGLDVSPGTELVLEEAIKKLHDVSAIKLEWPFSFVDDAVPSGVLLRTVQGPQNLRELYLIGVRIEQDELIDILRFLALRLRSFGTSNFGQKEPPLVRLCTLFQTAAIHNTELRDLGLGPTPSSYLELERHPFHSRECKRRKQHGLQASSLLKILEVRVPFLATTSHLHRQIRDWSVCP